MQIHILIDKSGSMKGESISIATQIVENILSSLRNNSACQEKANVCIVSYNISPSVTLPPTAVSQVTINIKGACEGPKNLGSAIELVFKQIIDDESTLFIITKGKPSDPQIYSTMCNIVKSKYKAIYVLHGNMDKSSMYTDLTGNIIPWQTFDSVKIIKKIYGGEELLDANGNEMLPKPPCVITL